MLALCQRGLIVLKYKYVGGNITTDLGKLKHEGNLGSDKRKSDLTTSRNRLVFATVFYNFLQCLLQQLHLN